MSGARPVGRRRAKWHASYNVKYGVWRACVRVSTVTRLGTHYDYSNYLSYGYLLKRDCLAYIKTLPKPYFVDGVLVDGVSCVAVAKTLGKKTYRLTVRVPPLDVHGAPVVTG